MLFVKTKSKLIVFLTCMKSLFSNRQYPTNTGKIILNNFQQRYRKKDSIYK